MSARRGRTMCPNALITHLVGAELKVYMAMKSFDWTGEGAFPGQEKIAARANRSAREVRRMIVRLLELGVVVREPRGRSYLYRFPDVPDDWEPGQKCPPKAEETGQKCPLKAVRSVRSKRSEVTKEVDTEEDTPKRLAGRASEDARCSRTSLELFPEGEEPSVGGGGSIGDRYQVPLLDPVAELEVSELADRVMERMDIPASSRGATLTSARWLLDHDGREPAEILRAVDWVVRDSAKWRRATNLCTVRANYAEILGDADSGRPPQPYRHRSGGGAAPEPDPAAAAANARYFEANPGGPVFSMLRDIP